MARGNIRGRKALGLVRQAYRTALAQGNAAVAFDLYAPLVATPGNLFLSRYSISSALAMTYAGARGTTQSERATLGTTS